MSDDGNDKRTEPAGDLSHIVQQEARRVLTERQFEPDPELVAAGWERRFITDGRRAQEMVDLYTELGFEIHLEPLQADDFEDDCADCRLLALLKFSTLYTRKKQ